MVQFLPVTDVYAREILDSKGNPTMEVEVMSGEKSLGKAQVPSGTSKGKYEAAELRDEEKRYHGLGVKKAVDHINDKIAREIIGMNVFEQAAIDEVLCKLDGSRQKENLGANTILGVSLATAKSAAAALGQPLYRYLGGASGKNMPIPMMNLIGGGMHVQNMLDFQEFLIVPVGETRFEYALQKGVEVYKALKDIFEKEGQMAAVGEEGNFAVEMRTPEEALDYLVCAVWKAGYRLGKDVVFAMDVAASCFYDRQMEKYCLKGMDKTYSSGEMVEYYTQLCTKYPIVSIEDGLDEDDWNGWKMLTQKLGEKVKIVGDDFFVTNPVKLEKGIKTGCANSVLIKMNQIGTLTETMEVIKTAKKAGYETIVSHRSGETEDTSMADLAVAFDCEKIKAGAPCRGERVAKYNRLLKIESELCLD